MSRKVTPLGNRVCVTLIDETEGGIGKTKGGLYTVETNRKEKPDPLKGEVISVGRGLALDNGTFIPPPVNVGDIILFDKFAATGVIDGDDRYVFVRVDSIYGVLEDIDE